MRYEELIRCMQLIKAAPHIKRALSARLLKGHVRRPEDIDCSHRSVFELGGFADEIREFGINNPISVRNGKLVDGMARLQAAILAGHEYVPVREL